MARQISAMEVVKAYMEIAGLAPPQGGATLKGLIKRLGADASSHFRISFHEGDTFGEADKTIRLVGLTAETPLHLIRAEEELGLPPFPQPVRGDILLSTSQGIMLRWRFGQGWEVPTSSPDIEDPNWVRPFLMLDDLLQPNGLAMQTPIAQSLALRAMRRPMTGTGPGCPRAKALLAAIWQLKEDDWHDGDEQDPREFMIIMRGQRFIQLLPGIEGVSVSARDDLFPIVN